MSGRSSKRRKAARTERETRVRTVRMQIPRGMPIDHLVPIDRGRVGFTSSQDVLSWEATHRLGELRTQEAPIVCAPTKLFYPRCTVEMGWTRDA